MSWIAVTLENDEKEALKRLAEREKRETRYQAALLIRESLERLGLLPPAPAANTPQQEATHAIQNHRR